MSKNMSSGMNAASSRMTIWAVIPRLPTALLFIEYKVLRLGLFSFPSSDTMIISVFFLTLRAAAPGSCRKNFHTSSVSIEDWRPKGEKTAISTPSRQYNMAATNMDTENVLP